MAIVLVVHWTHQRSPACRCQSPHLLSLQPILAASAARMQHHTIFSIATRAKIQLRKSDHLNYGKTYSELMTPKRHEIVSFDIQIVKIGLTVFSRVR